MIVERKSGSLVVITAESCAMGHRAGDDVLSFGELLVLGDEPLRARHRGSPFPSRACPRLSLMRAASSLPARRRASRRPCARSPAFRLGLAPRAPAPSLALARSASTFAASRARSPSRCACSLRFARRRSAPRCVAARACFCPARAASLRPSCACSASFVAWTTCSSACALGFAARRARPPDARPSSVSGCGVRRSVQSRLPQVATGATGAMRAPVQRCGATGAIDRSAAAPAVPALAARCGSSRAPPAAGCSAVTGVVNAGGGGGRAATARGRNGSTRPGRFGVTPGESRRTMCGVIITTSSVAFF